MNQISINLNAKSQVFPHYYILSLTFWDDSLYAN